MRVSIGGKIFLGVVLIQLMSAALVVGWFFYSIRSELNDLTRHNAQEAVLRSIEATEEYFHPAETVVQTVQRLLAGDVISTARAGQLERYFFEQLHLRPQFSGLYVGYPDGGFLYVMRGGRDDADGTRTKIVRQGPDGREVELTWRDQEFSAIRKASDPEDPYDPRARAWYQAAVEQRGVVWTKPYIFFTSRKPGITLAAPVKRDDGSIEGVIGVDIEMSEVSRFLTQIGLGLGGSAFVVTPEGEVIAHSSSDLIMPEGATNDESLRFRKVNELAGVEGIVGDRVLARLSDQPSAGAPILWEQESEGRDYFAAIGQMSNVKWPWLIMAIIPEKGLFDAARTGNMILIGIVLLASAMACAVGFALSQSIGRPFAALHRNAILAKEGAIDAVEPVTSSHKEIRELGDILQELAARRR